jgi:toxin ParE1/3/4
MENPDFPVVWSPEAEGDLLVIWHRGATRFSPRVADEHLREIHRAAMRLATAPLMGRVRSDLRPAMREIVIYPTVLFYRVKRGQVEVVRVVDGRRDIAALFAQE